MPALVTRTAVKEYIGNSASSTHDDFIDDVIDRVESAFTTAIGWNILTGAEVIYPCGLSGTKFTFEYGPVTAATVATLTDFSADTWTNLTAGTYQLRSNGRHSWIDYPTGFSPSIDYRISYTVGYESDSIPGDIQHCLAVFSALAYQKSGTDLNTDRGFDVVALSKGDKGISGSDQYRDPVELWNTTVAHYKPISI